MTDIDKRIDAGEVAALDALANQANSWQAKVEQHQVSAVEAAWHAGRALLEAKEICGHGKFQPWVEENFSAGYRSAARYMKLAANVTRVSDLESAESINSVLRAITPTPTKDGDRPEPKPKPDTPAPAPAPVDEAMALWDSIPGNQREKVKAAVTRLAQREVNRIAKEYDEKLRAAQAKHWADTLKAERESAATLKRDREALNKGIWTPSEYETIRACLHPDSRLSVSDEKLATAFRLFNEERIKALLVKKPGKPPAGPGLPSSTDDLQRRPRR